MSDIFSIVSSILLVKVFIVIIVIIYLIHLVIQSNPYLVCN